MSRGSRVQLINSVPRAMTGAGCRTSKLSPPCAACALSGDGNPGTICAQMCKWPFAHLAIIWSTPELDHAACCDREPERRHWQDLLLVRHQEVRIRPRSRGRRVHRLSSPLRPMPGVRTSKLVKACGPYALSGDANPDIIDAQMCKWPFAHIAIIWSTPELDHAGCCDREPEGRHWQDHLGHQPGFSSS